MATRSCETSSLQIGFCNVLLKLVITRMVGIRYRGQKTLKYKCTNLVPKKKLISGTLIEDGAYILIKHSYLKKYVIRSSFKIWIRIHM